MPYFTYPKQHECSNTTCRYKYYWDFFKRAPGEMPYNIISHNVQSKVKTTIDWNEVQNNPDYIIKVEIECPKCKTKDMYDLFSHELYQK